MKRPKLAALFGLTLGLEPVSEMQTKREWEEVHEVILALVRSGKAVILRHHPGPLSPEEMTARDQMLLQLLSQHDQVETVRRRFNDWCDQQGI